jgi:hypothetical protein
MHYFSPLSVFMLATQDGSNLNKSTLEVNTARLTGFENSVNDPITAGHGSVKSPNLPLETVGGAGQGPRPDVRR